MSAYSRFGEQSLFEKSELRFLFRIIEKKISVSSNTSIQKKKLTLLTASAWCQPLTISRTNDRCTRTNTTISVPTHSSHVPNSIQLSGFDHRDHGDWWWQPDTLYHAPIVYLSASNRCSAMLLDPKKLPLSNSLEPMVQPFSVSPNQLWTDNDVLSKTKQNRFGFMNWRQRAQYVRQNGKSRPVDRKYLPGCGCEMSLVSGMISFSDEFDEMYVGRVAWYPITAQFPELHLKHRPAIKCW